jgi:hypothetical protein
MPPLGSQACPREIVDGHGKAAELCLLAQAQAIRVGPGAR